MSLAPSSGVSSFCSTAVRISWIRRPATCHFGSIVRPKSVGFIEANWWTKDGVTVSAIRSITSRASDTGTPQGCQPPTECQARCSLLAETKSPHFAGNSSLEERPDPDTGQAPWRDGDLSPCDQNVAEPG